jgi:hypothetical protein
METKHTLGPWECRRAKQPDNTGGYDYAVVAPDKAIIAECFAHVDWREPGVSCEMRPAEANANLIAAAPDLLDAAKAAFETLAPQKNDDFVWATMSQLIRAIAKAKGEQS